LAKYLFQKRGVYYFERRIPKDVSANYSAPKIRKSLKTKRRADALALSSQISQRLDAYWASIRLENFSKLICYSPLQSARPLVTSTNQTIKMSEALDFYVNIKGKGRDKRFFAYAKRAIGYLFDAVSDKPISSYTRSDANALRDLLIERGLVVSSVKRNFEVVRAIFNVANREGDLKLSNPFSNVLMLHANDGKPRLPVRQADISRIQRMCIELDDDIRWLIALISDTGMRLAEACGVLLEDFKLDEEVPYLTIRPHTWRPLKTVASERVIPLVGASLWSARRVIQNESSPFAFPRYCNASGHKADSASNALNKWIKPHVEQGVVIHSFRHSLRDRLREIECPSDIIDQIGGWRTYGLGQRYGKGYSLSVMHKWLKQMV